MEKKYIMTDETRTLKNGTILHRIKAIRDFGDVKKGDLGGFIEKEENLSHDGDCWVSGDAGVYENAKIHDSVHVYGNARVFGNVEAYGYARVYSDAEVSDNASIRNDAVVQGNARVRGNACISDSAKVGGNAQVMDDAKVCGNSWLFNNVRIYGNAVICGNSVICDDAQIFGTASIWCAKIKQGASISNARDYITIGPIGSRSDWTTFYKNKDNDISVSCGCFCDTLDKFKERVESVYGENGTTPNNVYYTQYIDAITYVKHHIQLNMEEE